jgi:hypothetical protein
VIYYFIAGIVGAVLYSLGALALRMIQESGAASERAKEAVKAASITKKQAEIIAQPKTTDETISDLDNGRF